MTLSLSSPIRYNVVYDLMNAVIKRFRRKEEHICLDLVQKTLELILVQQIH